MKLIQLFLSLTLTTLTVALPCESSAQHVNKRPTPQKPAKTQKPVKSPLKSAGRVLLTPHSNATNKPAVSNRQQPTGNNRPAKTTLTKGLNSETLYTFSPNEIIYYDEYVAGERIGRNHFVLVTFNTDTKKSRLITGGKVEIEADELYVDGVDTDVFPPQVNYRYRNGKEWYININRKKEGPYHTLYWPTYHPTDFKSCTYEYVKMDMRFVRDYNGEVYKVDDSSVMYPVSSPDGRYKVTFQNGNRTISYRNNTYQIAPADAESVSIYDVYVDNSGGMYLNVCYRRNGNYLYQRYYMENSNTTLQKLPEDYWYDGLYVRKNDEAGKRGNYQLFDKKLSTHGIDWDKERLKTEYWIKSSGGDHEFTGSWKYDYVLIDNKQYGKSYPLDAWYDKDRDAFCWVGLDNNRLVRYTYLL